MPKKQVYLDDQLSGKPSMFVDAINCQDTKLAILDSINDMHCFVIDGRELSDWDNLNRTISTAFMFPGSHVNNWDALSDRLRDLEWLKRSLKWSKLKNITLLIDNADAFPGNDELFNDLIAMLNDCSSYWGENPVSRRGPLDTRPLIFCSIFVFLAKSSHRTKFLTQLVVTSRGASAKRQTPEG
jgi:RNAse (barnase) inhibitor barstar